MTTEQIAEYRRMAESERDAEIASAKARFEAKIAAIAWLAKVAKPEERDEHDEDGALPVVTRARSLPVTVPVSVNGNGLRPAWDDGRHDDAGGGAAHGEIAPRVREYVNQHETFDWNTILSGVRALNPLATRENVGAALKRMVATGDVRRTRRGTNKRPALYERVRRVT